MMVRIPRRWRRCSIVVGSSTQLRLASTHPWNGGGNAAAAVGWWWRRGRRPLRNRSSRSSSNSAAEAGSAEGGVSPTHYSRLGVGPTATAADLQEAYVKQCAQCTGPLAVLELAELAESLRATLAAAPSAPPPTPSGGSGGVHRSSERMASSPSREGELRMPQKKTLGGAGQETADEAQMRAHAAMQRALEYKTTRRKQRGEKALGVGAGTAVESTRSAGADTSSSSSGIEDESLEAFISDFLNPASLEPEEEEQEKVPAWVKLQKVTDAHRIRIVAQLQEDLATALLLGGGASSSRCDDAIAKAERRFRGQCGLLNDDIKELNLQAPVARFHRSLLDPDKAIEAAMTAATTNDEFAK